MARFSLALISVAVGLLSGSAFATITVSFTCSGTTTMASRSYASGEAIALTATELADTCQMTIRGASFGDTIGVIRLTGSRSTNLQILIAESDIFPDLPEEPRTAVAAGWSGFATDIDPSFQSRISLACYVTGNISGEIDVAHIRVLRTSAGTIFATVKASGANIANNDRAIGFVRANEITGSLTATDGSIGDIEVTTSISGDIIADTGALRNITVGGALGPNASLEPITVRSRNGIDFITATTISANITANHGNVSTDPDATTGKIQRVKTTGTTATASADGYAFAGSLEANGIPAGSDVYATGIDITSNPHLLTNLNVVAHTIIPANITIEGDCNQRMVFAGKMTGTISIGRHALRRIEAWGGFTGEITIGGISRPV